MLRRCLFTLLLGTALSAQIPESAPFGSETQLPSPFAINAQTATYQALASDFAGYKTVSVASGTFTITLVASGAQPASGQFIRVVNYGSGFVTIARSGQNINGGTASLVLPPGTATSPASALVLSDASNYFAWTAGPAVVTAAFTASGNGNGVTASTTEYVVSTNVSATLNIAQHPMLRAGTLKDLYVVTGTTQNAGAGMICSIYQNGSVASAFSASVPAGGTAGVWSDTTTALAVAAGDLIAIGCLNNYSGGVSATVLQVGIGIY